MSVSFVHATPDAERLILYIARVSSDQSNEDLGLIRYLIRHKHWSPFEMASMCLEFNTSRAIAAQILRHDFHFQEFSQRYSEVGRPLETEARVKGGSNRQGSVPADQAVQGWWRLVQDAVNSHAYQAYQSALKMGIAAEVARFLLPMSAPTRLYVHGTLRNWIHYIKIREDPEAVQAEHVELAREAKTIFTEHFPIISEALGWTDAA